MNVEFQEMFQITKISYKNRRNPAERNAQITATFGNGDEHLMNFKDTDELVSFNIDPPVLSQSVKFTISKVYGTINNGGSFQIYGSKCIDADDLDKPNTPQANGLEKVAGVNPKALKPLFNVEDSKAVVLLCKDSLSNSKKLDHVKQKPGNKVIVRCVESCANSRGVIYGENKYSKDSAICKAAFHSTKLKAEGGLVKLIFREGQRNYKSTVKNGVKSKSKSRSDITLTFEAAEEKSDIILQNGSKVDIKQNGKWLPGIINSVRETLMFGKSVKVTIEGAEGSQKPIEINYPNKSVIKPCGDQVKNRDCKGSRLNPNTNRPIKIKFVPGTYNTPGDFLLDKGELFGTNSRPFGWSKDMSSRIKTRVGGNRPELDSLVEFPPSPQSKFCSKPSPDVLCDKVTWSVKVGHGRFNVKLYIGDPQANTRLDIKINDDYAVEGQTIAKGELKIYEGVYDSINEYITVASECRNDCEYAMSKLNMIEVFPFSEDNAKDEDPTPEKVDPCGNATQGGKCDKGPDVTHCLYDDPTAEGAKYCTGNLLMVQVSKQYRCPSQREKYKCVKRMYKDQAECLNFCTGKCEKGACA